MNVNYETHLFHFEPSHEDPYKGRLQLDSQQKTLLAKLLNIERDDWELDRNGERLPADQLFALSPWSIAILGGRLKLLCRFINLQDGSVYFSTPDTYAGDTSSYARSSI